MVSDRDPPEPDRTRLEFVSSEVFDEVAERMSESAFVSMSEILMLI